MLMGAGYHGFPCSVEQRLATALWESRINSTGSERTLIPVMERAEGLRVGFPPQMPFE